MRKVAMLAFYLKLYDDIGLADLRRKMDGFYDRCAARLAGEGLEAVRMPVCRTRDEFAAAFAAMKSFSGIDALLTLHLGYSPSLESVEFLRDCPVPIVAMDTTPDFTLGGDDFIMPNHGIHGVQDMCSLLGRYGKRVTVVAGLPDETYFARVAQTVRVVGAAGRLGRGRVGRMGKPFAGMGDFQLEDERLRRELGFEVVDFDFANAAAYAPTEEELQAEYRAEQDAYSIAAPFDEDYRLSLQAGLMMRRWVEAEGLAAATFTFFDITKDCGVPKVPFFEASKQMARGVGYAGEGDVITAALTGALLSAWPDTSFAEMFCPDWERNLIFLSHMGEINLRVCDRVSVEKKPYNFSSSGDVVCGFGCFVPGRAVYASLTPAARGCRLVASRVEMAEPPFPVPGTIAGWMKPDQPLPAFLERFSQAGGTHHGAVVYGATLDEMELFARQAGLDFAAV